MKNRYKTIVAWLFLFILVLLILVLSYFKFFGLSNPNIEEKNIDNSSTNAVYLALSDITVNFNQNPNLEKYCNENNLTIKASVNNYSIFISYISDTTTTYEFKYNNFWLKTTIDVVEKEKFSLVYYILVEAVQKRINNVNPIKELIDNFLETNIIIDGLTKSVIDNRIEYGINITKKIKYN